MSFGPKFRMGEPIERAANDGRYDQRQREALAGRLVVRWILRIQKTPPHITVVKARNKLTFL